MLGERPQGSLKPLLGFVQAEFARSLAKGRNLRFIINRLFVLARVCGHGFGTQWHRPFLHRQV